MLVSVSVLYHVCFTEAAQEEKNHKKFLWSIFSVPRDDDDYFFSHLKELEVAVF